ncbi:MAG TPA: anthranilate synthase component I family protein [Acidobacteriota bacterium]|nr:anthranilate synthase component I family protein [Acidobacteriota bacterium]
MGTSKIDHKSVLADLLTPVSAYLKVAGAADRAFLLESVEGGEKIGRYSFIGVEPRSSFDGTFAEFREKFPEPEPPQSGLPPFAGGAVGVFTYDMVRELERIPDLKENAFQLPSVMMDFYSTILAFDHVRHEITIISREGKDRIREIEERLRNRHLSVSFSDLEPGVEGATTKASSTLELRSSFTPEQFMSAVERAKEYIRAGDIFQVVLSQRFEADYAGDPFTVYRMLRYVNPSPYMFFLKRGEVSIVGSSPEMLVRVQGRDLEYRPIAGTRRRGRTPSEEEKLAEELIGDAKERAEHLMLVDLGRNDLGRVSEYGAVRVEDLMVLEKYSHVMHLVSSLRGRLRQDLDRFDALAACFPAGTVSGAPKVRAMEIIEELEPDRRGVYAGAIGYLDYSGNLDSCIAIRTMVLSDKRVHLQAGAGIVADSVPELEHKECWNKAMALVRAIELAERFSAKQGV